MVEQVVREAILPISTHLLAVYWNGLHLRDVYAWREGLSVQLIPRMSLDVPDSASFLWISVEDGLKQVSRFMRDELGNSELTADDLLVKQRGVRIFEW